MTGADAGGASADLDQPQRSYRRILSDLNYAQKPGAGVPAYTRWVNRRLARYLAAAAHRLGVTANAVTFMGAAVSLAALVLLIWLPRTPVTAISVAGLLALGYVLDSADGQVSRLARSSGPSGEWLDHVIDALRTPAIHVAVFIGFVQHDGNATPALGYVALLYAVLSSGQFMSQILAEQLGRQQGRGASATTGGTLKSVALLPIDMGTICWMFVFWAWPDAFGIVYVAMFVINTLYSGISMHRKYQNLHELQGA